MIAGSTDDRASVTGYASLALRVTRATASRPPTWKSMLVLANAIQARAVSMAAASAL
jgi:hypothetical protein